MTAAPSGRVTKPTPNVASAPSSRPISDSRGKERVADHHGEEGEDEEIVELEPVADDDGDDAFQWKAARFPFRRARSRVRHRAETITERRAADYRLRHADGSWLWLRLRCAAYAPDVAFSISQFQRAWRIFCRACPDHRMVADDGLDMVFSGLRIAFSTWSSSPAMMCRAFNSKRRADAPAIGRRQPASPGCPW